MFTNKKRFFFERLQWLNLKISYTVHVINGIYDSINQGTNSVALKMAYFNHIQANCFSLLP